MKTKNLMSDKVVTITEDTTMPDAWRIMYEKNIRHLPVTDQYGLVTGMVSDRDIQRAMVVDRSNGRTAEEIFLSKADKVSAFMSPIVFTALPDSPLTWVVEEMMNKKVSAVVIVNAQMKCEGIVTSNDILRVFLKQMNRDKEILERPMSFFFSNTLY